MDIDEIIESAVTYFKEGDFRQSERLFKEVLSVQPNNNIVLHYLGVIGYQMQDFDLAIEYLTKALKTEANDPINFFSSNILANAFHRKGKIDEAIFYYQRALELEPMSAEVCYNLGNIFREKQEFYESIRYYKKAMEVEPGKSAVYNNLAIVLKDMGLLNEAENCLRQAIESDPSCSIYFSNLLFLRNYNSKYDAGSIFDEHLQFARRFEKPLSTSIIRRFNRRERHRKLRIGYVSPDFKFHSVAFFIEPVLISHDREHFEIFCYSDWPFPDEVTRRIQQQAGQWRNIVGMPDKDVCDLICKDEIDILVDLAGHASNIRMLVFARKPAPVQVSWIGYPATTGLSAMDYKIVDGYTDPHGMTEKSYVEELTRLPECFLCYQPQSESPEVGALPALSSGYITFGSFNNFAKVSHEVAELWAGLLRAVPLSRLVMKAKSLSDGLARRYAMELFTGMGIEPERVDLLSWESSFKKHLDTYNCIDIALDTFPYNGTTTTCEALWMGVPVITLAGKTHASRVGVSLLSNIGISELVAKTPQEYLSIAVDLACDLKKLQVLRVSLRDMIRRSTLTDAKRLTLNLEDCFRSMWRSRCGA